MSTTRVVTPTSRLRFGHARADVTPPVGHYHRVWGAARHDRSTGIHRPLYADVMAFAPADASAPALLRVQLDLVGLVKAQHETMARRLSAAAGIPPEQVVITYSHTHASGRFEPDRFELPGGELLPAYLEQLYDAVEAAGCAAVAGMQQASIAYAVGRCNMAANRDYWDQERRGYVCGYNPDAPADDTLIAGRVSDAAGKTIAALVNYACHPTTLAWLNTLTSPDYVGALREEVERALGVPCIFLQGACGDLGPRDDYLGDPAVADRNGRQVAYAALSALSSLGPVETDFVYQGHVVSGATLGVWAHAPFDAARRQQASHFAGGLRHAALPLKPLPDRAKLQTDMQSWLERQQSADAAGDAVVARDAGARAERARRWLAYLDDIPAGPTYPLQFTVHRFGDAIWVTCGGEPYSMLQVELRRRFPHVLLVLSPLSGDYTVAYLMPADRYGIGLYQEEPSILARGCLEVLITAIADAITELI
jgi:hypothetical protein